jgi:hypothetical protein
MAMKSAFTAIVKKDGEWWIGWIEEVKEYSKILPLSVQLGIHHEGKKTERTALMRRQDRSLSKAAKGNRQLHDLLDKMYERPVRLLKSKK